MKNRSMALDALRGIAALFVVFYHTKELNWVGISAIWHSHRLSPDLNAFFSYLIIPFFFFGFSMVPLFFVISGYCIHRPNVSKLSKDPEHKLNLGEYFKRRLWRIYPVLIATLALTYILDFYTKAHIPLDTNVGDLSWKSFFINLASLQNLAGPVYGSNAPLWTLGMELHFYFLYPFLFWLTKKIGPAKTTLIVFCISLVSSVGLRLIHSDLLIFLPFWFTWMVGFFIAECEAGRCTFDFRKWRYAIGLSLAVAIFLGLKKENHLALPFFAPAFGTLLWWSLNDNSKSFWERPLGYMFAYVGIFSYSLYAIHYPLLVFLRAFVNNGEKSQYIITPILFTFVSVLAAIAMYWIVERWSLRVPAKRTRSNATQDATINSPLPSPAE